MATGTPVALATNGTVRLARGLASRTYTDPSFTAYCTLMGPTTSSASAMARVCASRVSSTSSGQRLGRERAGRVPRVHACLLHVLHHPGDHHVAGAVPHGVHVDLDGVLEEPVHENGAFGGGRPFTGQ